MYKIQLTFTSHMCSKQFIGMPFIFIARINQLGAPIVHYSYIVTRFRNRNSQHLSKREELSDTKFVKIFAPLFVFLRTKKMKGYVKCYCGTFVIAVSFAWTNGWLKLWHFGSSIITFWVQKHSFFTLKCRINNAITLNLTLNCFTLI